MSDALAFYEQLVVTRHWREITKPRPDAKTLAALKAEAKRVHAMKKARKNGA